MDTIFGSFVFWRNSPLHQIAVLGLVMFALQGCRPNMTRSGQMGNGSFKYVCSYTGEDLGCDPELAWGFPDAIAVGSEFNVDYAEDSIFGDGLGMEQPVISASSARVAPWGNGFQMVKPGYTALLASNGEIVIDFTHIYGEDVAGLDLSCGEGNQDQIELQIGESLSCRVAPLSQQGEYLAGRLTFDWTESDPLVATVVNDTLSGNIADVKGIAEGEATITVSQGQHTLQRQVTVLASSNPDTDTTPDINTDTNPDVDSGTDTDEMGDAGIDGGEAGAETDAGDNATDGGAIQDGGNS